MKIVAVTAREIFNSRGMPTIACDIVLDNGNQVTASVPTGTSRGQKEAIEVRDGGTRLMGQGVLAAIHHIETTIAPLLIGTQPNFITTDELLLNLDGTPHKSKLGANTLLAVSSAVCKAQAMAHHCEPYELIAEVCGYDQVALPFPMFNVINGGLHASNGLHIQEYMIMPVGVASFAQAMEIGVTFFHVLKKVLRQNGLSTAVGDEGGFASDFQHETQPLDCIMEAIEYMQQEYTVTIMIALDVAASHFYNRQLRGYNWQGDVVSSDDLINWYKQLLVQYPIYAIEDGLSEEDREGWKRLMEQIGSRIQVVGDDIFVTDSELIYAGIEEGLANTVLIKPNQIGTVTETLQAIKLVKELERNIIVSHRSGETNDTFIADIAVGTSAGQIKAGGLCRGERIAKYNRLLQIEQELLTHNG
jgi:enolase